jgi:hypothetical protein
MKRTEPLKKRRLALIIIDVFIMIVLIINLNLIVFDALFELEIVNTFFRQNLSAFYFWYDSNIHAYFYEIDLAFISVFLAEFFVSWAISVARKEYHKWFFYPIFHWYDLIGCIPIGSLRFVRILRVFSILVRMHNLRLINLFKTYIFVKAKKYYDIIVEEVSDRVVVNVLNGVQEEIATGGPVMDDILKKVIRPKEEVIVEWVARRIEYALRTTIIQHKEEIEKYVDYAITEGLQKNASVRTIDRLPLVGRAVNQIVDETISNVVYNIIETGMNDLASKKNRRILKESTDILLSSLEMRDQDEQLNKVLTEISHDVIEIVKKQVMVKKWKLKEMAEKDVDETERDSVEFLLNDDDLEKELEEKA